MSKLLSKSKTLNKSVQPSEQLNKQMLTYGQLNNLIGVNTCLQKGADALYQNGALLLISAVYGHVKLAKLCLSVAHYSQEQLQVALKHVQRADLKKLLEAKINEQF